MRSHEAEILGTNPALVWANSLIKVGLSLLLLAVVTLLAIYFPVIKEELRYFVSSKVYRTSEPLVALVSEKSPQEKDSRKVMVPVNEEFGIVIPKIGANAPVINQVDPFNPAEYQQKLTQGVAHAKGSAHPGSLGDVFLFAHSSANFYQATRYNAVFYLLNKLEKDDLIYVTYQKRLYKYKVTDTKVVNQEAVEYLSQNHTDKTITLMTCWPAGTTLQRLLVRGEFVEG